MAKKIKVPQPVNERHVMGTYSWPIYPIEYAINELDVAMAEKFIEAGADVNIDLREGWTPLHIAFDRALDGMAQDSRTTPYPEILKIIKLLLKKGASLDNKEISGLKPLDLINEYAYDRNGFDTLLTLFKPAIPNIAELIVYDGYVKD
jgi:hypothetical protein